MICGRRAYDYENDLSEISSKIEDFYDRISQEIEENKQQEKYEEKLEKQQQQAKARNIFMKNKIA